jgi:hypothetical protein
MDIVAEIERRNAAWRAEEVARTDAWRAEDLQWRHDTEQRLGQRHTWNYVLQGLQIVGTILASVFASLVAVGKIELW